MKADGHLARAEELYQSIHTLAADSGAHTSALTELIFGCAFHYCAYGCARWFKRHSDVHAGLPQLLRAEGANDIANAFGQLDTLRHGRWYGGKGNGEAIAEALSLLEVIRRWSVTQT